MGDRNELTQHLLTLLKNPELWEQFSQQGINYIRQNFDLPTQTQQLETIYRETIHHKTTSIQASPCKAS